MNALAEQLNQIIGQGNPYLLEMMSQIGKNLFFPKGILSQSAEAKQKAHKLNATIGIATEGQDIMHFPSIMNSLQGIQPNASLTYAPSFGIPELRKAWKSEQLEKNPTLTGKATSLPVVTSGITHAISAFADVWVDPGDVVILPDMMWGNYNMILNVRKGATIRNYAIFDETGGYNLTAFETCVQQEAEKNDKIIVLLNFPHNPTGYAISKTEAEQMVAILENIAQKGTNVIVVCDDAYFGLFYEQETLKESIFAHLCGRHPRLLAVKLDGATKENYVWGLRVGFITYGTQIGHEVNAVYDALERKTAGGIRGTISNASHLGQTLVLKSMQNPHYKDEKAEKFGIMQKRAQKVKRVLEDPKYKSAFEAFPFNSGYFMCIRLHRVSAEPLRLHLLDKYGVGLIALGEKNLRIAFSCLEETDIPELFDIVLKGIQDLSA